MPLQHAVVRAAKSSADNSVKGFRSLRVLKIADRIGAQFRSLALAARIPASALPFDSQIPSSSGAARSLTAGGMITRCFATPSINGPVLQGPLSAGPEATFRVLPQQPDLSGLSRSRDRERRLSFPGHAGNVRIGNSGFALSSLGGPQRSKDKAGDGHGKKKKAPSSAPFLPSGLQQLPDNMTSWLGSPPFPVVGKEAQDLGADGATKARDTTVQRPPDVLSGVAATAHSVQEDSKLSGPPVSLLRLQTGACCLPHPEKKEKGGEDAYFVAPNCPAIGVADGVGGWAQVGVDAGLYARELMARSKDAIDEEPRGAIDPRRVLEKAHTLTKCRGSSTACILLLNNDKLVGINLGDSGFLVVRQGVTIFKSPRQQHTFNFPYQLSSQGSDPVSSAEVFTVDVAFGDVIIMGTDGLFDNLYDQELKAVAYHSTKAGQTPQKAAEQIAALAHVRSMDKNHLSPFAQAAHEANFRFYGGKQDDITVLVSYVTSTKSTGSDYFSRPGAW